MPNVESSVTGEFDASKKLSYEECVVKMVGEKNDLGHTDCFIVSGAKVLEGVGRYAIIAVGEKSFNGRIMKGIVVSFFVTVLLTFYSPASRHSKASHSRELPRKDWNRVPLSRRQRASLCKFAGSRRQSGHNDEEGKSKFLLPHEVSR